MTEVQGVWQNETDFEVIQRGATFSFDKCYADGGCRVAIDGYTMETFHMTGEQFAAFKKWIMEN